MQNLAIQEDVCPVQISVYLFEREMNFKKKDFKNWDRNYFILKYIVRLHCMLLVILKILTLKSLLNLRKLNSVTQGHTDL